MKQEIGIMQGRLSPDAENRFQFFPAEWQHEFEHAKSIGVGYIEWLADWYGAEANPILTGKNLSRVRLLTETSCVGIRYVCADYFMVRGFLGNDAGEACQILKNLIDHSTRLIAEPIIVIPFLEKQAIINETDKEEIIRNLSSVLRETSASPARLAFETEMSAEEIFDFLLRLQNPRVGVCYDIGNCTSYGFDCPRDIRLLSGRIFDIHVKDRKIGQTSSLPLGEGDADFEGCFAAVCEIGYTGPIVLQAWRGNGTYFDDAARQCAFVRRVLHQ